MKGMKKISPLPLIDICKLLIEGKLIQTSDGDVLFYEPATGFRRNRVDNSHEHHKNMGAVDLNLDMFIEKDWHDDLEKNYPDGRLCWLNTQGSDHPCLVTSLVPILNLDDPRMANTVFGGVVEVTALSRLRPIKKSDLNG